MTDMKEEVLTHSSLEAGGTACHAGPQGHSGNSGGRGARKTWAKLFIVVSVGKARQSK